MGWRKTGSRKECDAEVRAAVKEGVTCCGCWEDYQRRGAGLGDSVVVVVRYTAATRRCWDKWWRLVCKILM